MNDNKCLTLEELEDRYIGKPGTPKRDAYEQAVQEEIQAYHIGQAIKQAKLRLKMFTTPRLLVFTIIFLAVFHLSAQGVVGDWTGSLQVAPGMALRLGLHIASEQEVTMDSPDQGAFGLPMEVKSLKEDDMQLALPQAGLSMEGRLLGDSLDLTAVQFGKRMPLVMHRAEKVKRPQTPVAPFPYSTEEISVDADGAVLAGTLTLPDTPAPGKPVLVLVTGSGQQDRDETLFGHRPFAVIADRLARKGIASLRYDDRGCEASTGEAAGRTTLDNAQDAKAMIEYLRQRSGFGTVGLLGHSEGGLIGYMLGGENDGPDFVVSVAGPTVQGESVVMYQNEASLRKAGADDAQVQSSLPMIKERLAGIDDPWTRFFLDYSPEEALKALDSRGIPVLVIFGEKDQQVPPSLCVDNAKQLLPKANIKVYEGLNHLMQHCGTGWIDEYSTIEETFSEEVMSDIASFILK